MLQYKLIYDIYLVAVVSIVTATIRFTYTPNYPDTPPDTYVTNSNLTTIQITELEQLLREQVSSVLWSSDIMIKTNRLKKKLVQ